MTKSTDMKWPLLNTTVASCQDESTLRKWLRQELDAGGPSYRALRVYGRLSYVRRQRELREILGTKEEAA